jgi:mannosyltransferase PIG-V
MSSRLRQAGRRLLGDATTALPGWVTARVVVLGALAFSHYLFNHLHASVTKQPLHQGLLSWDGDWYRRLALHGYAGIPRSGVRFFPLYPLTARVLAVAFGGMVDVALLMLANVPALLYGALLVRLVKREGGDTAAATRAAWLVALVPPAFVLAFGYSEAIAGCLAVGVFLSLRSRRWWSAAAFGYLSGLTRPSGALLALPALIEVARDVRRVSIGEAGARLAAVVAPVAGVATYLAWVGARFGTPLLPFSIQQRPYLRGGTANPVDALLRAGRAAFNGQFVPNGIHFPLLVVAIVLAVVACTRWPASYGAYAVVTVLVALSAKRFGSVERYCFDAFPLVLALVSLTRSRRVETGVVVVSGACMGAFATLAFLGLYIP